MRRGLVESIELAFNIKFGRDGLALFPSVRKVDDFRRLKALQRAVFKAQKIKDVTRLLRPRRTRASTTAKTRG